MLPSVTKAVMLFAAVTPLLAQDYPSNPQRYPPVEPYPVYKEPPVHPPKPNTYRQRYPAAYDPQSAASNPGDGQRDESAVQLGLKGPGQGVPCDPSSKQQCPWILQCQCKDCSGHGGCRHYCC